MNALPKTDNPFEALSEQVNMTIVVSTDQEPPTEFVESIETQATTDYDQFKLVDSNRVINTAHVNKLIKAIRAKNMLHLKPIDVNENLEIIDGQHRLAAARALNVPVYYRVVPGLTKEDMNTLNTASKNWTNVDWLNYYTKNGFPAYELLSKFMETFTTKEHKFSITTAQYLLTGNNPGLTEDFRSGFFQMGNWDNAANAANFIIRIHEELNFKSAFDTRFIQAINYCLLNVEGFRQDEFITKVALQQRELVRCVSQPKYLELFEALYNKWRSADKRIRFR